MRITRDRSTADSHLTRRGLLLLVVALGHLQQVISELCLDWPLDAADIGAEHDLVELRHHLTAAKAAQVATALT